MTNLNILILNNFNHFTKILVISTIIHIIFLILISYNFKIKNWLNTKFKNNLNKYTFYYFFFILIFYLFLKHNILHLDNIVVQTKIGDVNVTITGEYLNYIFNHFGDAAVFTFGTRLSFAVVSKLNINVVSKIGISVLGGGSNLYTYRSIRNATNTTEIDPNFTATITFKDINLNTTTDYILPKHPFLDLFLGTNTVPHFNSGQLSIRNLNGNRIINSNIDLSDSPVLKEVFRLHPEWNKNFNLTPIFNKPSNFVAWSPLEENKINIVDWLTNILTNQLYVEIIGIYLLIMLGVIFICKSLTKNIEFKFLSNITIFKWPIGSYIKRLLNWYINLWQKSSNIWIFFILITLLIANCGSTYTLIRILLVLNKINNN